MKQFLRYIFTLAAMLMMVVGNAWGADCTIVETYNDVTASADGKWYDYEPFGQITLCSTRPNLKIVSISISITMDNEGAQGFEGELKTNNGETLGKCEVSRNKTTEYTFKVNKSGISSFILDASDKEYSAKRKVQISNITVVYECAPSFEEDIVNITLDDTPVGQTSTKKVTIGYESSATTVTLLSSEVSDNKGFFSISPSTKAVTTSRGTVEYTISFAPTFSVQGATAQYIIKGEGETKVTINVTGTSFDVVAPIHTWKNSVATTYKVGEPNLDLSTIWTSNSSGSITYRIKKDSFKPSGMNNEGAIPPSINGNVLTLGQAGTLVIEMVQEATTGFYAKTSEQKITINKYDIDASLSQSSALRNEIIDNPFSLSYTDLDFDVESKNTNIAEYHKDTKKIQTYFTDGTAYFQITRPEDYKYNALNQQLTLTVNASTEPCDIFNDPTERNFSTEILDFSGHAGYAYEIPENVRAYADSVYITAKKNGENYFYLQYSTDGGNNWTDFPGPLSLSADYKTFGLKIPDNLIVTHIRPYAKTGATLRKDYKDFRVTRKQFLTPQIDDDTFHLTQTNSDVDFAGTFDLDWSSCSSDIRLLCDNPHFTITPSYIDASSGQGTKPIVVTYTITSEEPVLTGTLTIYDQSQTKQITLSCEHMLQVIYWPQYFYNIEADENGNINTSDELEAIARTIKGSETNQPISYTLSVSPSDNASLTTSDDGKTYLNITGLCEGTITASVDGFTDENGITYSANSAMREIRIRKAGDKCNTTINLITEEIALSDVLAWNPKSIEYELEPRPYKELEFYSHVNHNSYNNNLTISFSKDGGSSWINSTTYQDILKDYDWDNPYVCTHIPVGANRIKFTTTSTTNTFINLATLMQDSYLRVNLDTILIEDAIVNIPFESSFIVEYSDIPLIQYSITNNNNLDLKLTPDKNVNNNCGDYGSYTFTITGTSTYPQTVTETITLHTSAGDRKEIPITITATLDDTYYFNQQNGSWDDLSNWQVGEKTPASLPTPSNPVVISKAATISSDKAIAYSIEIAEGGSVAVNPTGGLTVHAGGFTGADKNNLSLYNTKEGAGYIRIAKYFTEEVIGEMPNTKVFYQTRSTLDNGANLDARWQYIGAPGAECPFTVDYITWLYHWSESQGWINKTGTFTLEPFAGYAITQYGQPTYELVAKPITSNKTITLTKTDTGDGMKGDNLFANSYMAPIDAKNFTDDDFTGNLEKTFYIYNSGSWNDWNKQDNTIGNNGSKAPGQYCAIPALSSSYLEHSTIPSMQGVYMIANEDGATITLNYEKHVWKAGTKSNTNMHEPMRSPSQNINEEDDSLKRLRIQINSANSGADRMYIIQDAITTTGYDNGYDAPNLSAEGLANIYTNEHFGQMEVSCSNHIDSTFVGFTAGSDSIYTLRFNAIIGDDLHLLDLDNDSLILLEEDATYTFHATPHSKNDLRFQILLHPEKNLDFGEEEKDEIYTDLTDVHTTQVWSHGSCIYINNVPANTIATLYNISGNKLLTTPIHHTPYTLDLSYLPKGVYMLQLNTQVYKFVIQ